MNRVIAGSALLLLMSSLAFSQSLGDVARQNRQAKQGSKKAAHVYTNDEIPSVTVAPSPAAGTTETAASEDTDSKKAEAQPSEGENKPAESAQKNEAASDKGGSQRAKAEEQKKAVELLQRELEVAQREQQIQNTVFYTDAGSRLRAPKEFADKQKLYQDQIEAKTKALADAKQKLEELEEDARRSGEPASEE